MRNWQIIHPDYTTVLYKRDNEFLIKVKPAISESNPDVKVTSGGVYHLTDLVNGNSYTLNFKYLNPSQMDVGEVLAAAPYLNGEVVIGLASKTGDNYELVENACITINKDNYLDYYGNNFSINFKMENIINPCIIFYYMGSGMGYEIYFGVGDVSLIDDSKAKEDGFLAKLFAWFQEKFDAIGESFTNLGDKLTELKQGLINLKDNLIDGIKSLFVPDEAFIATWKEELEVLLQERLGIIWDAGDFFIALIQTIGDLLTTTADDIHYELPEMVIELNGQTYTLWQAQQVDFSFLEKNAFFSMLYNLYKAILNVLLGIPLLNYAKKEMDATLHN